jgi:hypothetical protein
MKLPADHKIIDKLHPHAFPISMMMLPSASEVARSPGYMSVVASICSRMAGPVMAASSGSFSRS